ncbi:MAG: HAD-IIIA family hydrolase [Chlorobi bacterium]|nr:HAD-IIIA family hydrolase [Chlorobiota bacterium]
MAEFLKDIDDSWCLFLDRDGVINKRIYGGYVTEWKKFRFQPGAQEALATFANKFKYIFVVTNQQGVGKGLMTISQLVELHSDMVSEIESKGGRITKIYFCTDLASLKDNCRKPSTVMAKKAKQDYPDIDFSKSVMIGDSESDIIFGKNAAMHTVLHLSTDNAHINAEMKVGSLLEFAKYL